MYEWKLYTKWQNARGYWRINSKILKFFTVRNNIKDKKNKIETIPSYEKKCKSIPHAIISAVRSRSFLSPLHITLAVMFHRKFGSKSNKYMSFLRILCFIQRGYVVRSFSYFCNSTRNKTWQLCSICAW